MCVCVCDYRMIIIIIICGRSAYVIILCFVRVRAYDKMYVVFPKPIRIDAYTYMYRKSREKIKQVRRKCSISAAFRGTPLI